MSDPQDLLYTNQFLSTDILSTESLIDNTKYYDRFQDYTNTTSESQTKKYIETDEYESSLINLDRSLNQKWPVNKNKNHYPLFDTYINDISSNRYKKNIMTKINIDSINRNTSVSANPNNFTISLNKTFNNVTKIYINDIIFSNVNQSVNNSNNNLCWQYPAENFLVENNINLSIMPIPANSTNPIKYSELPNAVYKYTTSGSSSNYVSNIQNYLIYQTDIPPGYYTIDEMTDTIRFNTLKIEHEYNSVNSEIIEEPYLAYPRKIGTPHLFSTQINPITSTVRFVNRIEEIEIVAMQSFSPYNINFKNTDIFYDFSSSKDYLLDTSYIYITIPALEDTTFQYYQNIYNINNTNPFPLVITNLDGSIGNINGSIFNYTIFYDLNIYLNNGYTETELESICYYKFIDTIKLSNNDNITYLRFALKLSSGMLNGNLYDSNGKTIKPAITQNIIYSTSLNSYLNYYQNTNVIFRNFDFITNSSFIGRALLFRWIFDKNNGNYVNYEFNTINQKKRSLLKILSWPIANQSLNILTKDFNNGFNFVQTNYQSQFISSPNSTVYPKQFPQNSLNLYSSSNKYYFISSSYIFLKILINDYQVNNVNEELINATTLNTIQYDQIYINDNDLNVGIGEDYTYIPNCNNLNILKKNYGGIVAKIIVSPLPGNIDITNSNIINNNNYNISYNKVIDDLSEITIQAYDSNMQLLNTTTNFSFTLNINQDFDVLKETLINSKTNNVSSNGNYI